jgi:hypothetical protein
MPRSTRGREDRVGAQSRISRAARRALGRHACGDRCRPTLMQGLTQVRIVGDALCRFGGRAGEVGSDEARLGRQILTPKRCISWCSDSCSPSSACCSPGRQPRPAVRAGRPASRSSSSFTAMPGLPDSAPRQLRLRLCDHAAPHHDAIPAVTRASASSTPSRVGGCARKPPLCAPERGPRSPRIAHVLGGSQTGALGSPRCACQSRVRVDHRAATPKQISLSRQGRPGHSRVGADLRRPALTRRDLATNRPGDRQRMHSIAGTRTRPVGVPGTTSAPPQLAASGG